MTIITRNRDKISSDYDGFKDIPRPGHADFTSRIKYLGFADMRGSGHFSGRITWGLVAAGVVARKVLGNCEISAGLISAGGSEDIEKALTQKIDISLTEMIANAEIIYFAGRNNGVAEELALKTNETTRKKSDFLPGTFAVHGIEEVMNRNEVLIWIDPFPGEQEKFKECLIDGVGMKIIAVADRPTIFPTIIIPAGGEYAEYVQLAVGWNILIETGTALGINLDKPQRARKIGNEFLGG